MPEDLKDALRLEGPQYHDLAIEAAGPTISCIAVDDKGDSWVMPYHLLEPSRFLHDRFELCFAGYVVNVTLREPDSTSLCPEDILQAVAQWRLSLIAHGERFGIQVAKRI